MTTVIPSPNPSFYIVPDVAGPGVFSKSAIQDALYVEFKREAAHANSESSAAYQVAWSNYRQLRDENQGNPVSVPEPTPEPTVEVLRDAEGNPGWFVNLSKPVVPLNVYVPPNYHQADPLGTKVLVHQAPPGDVMPIGYEYTDVDGLWGPAGTTWIKIASPTPFGVVPIYVPKVPNA